MSDSDIVIGLYRSKLSIAKIAKQLGRSAKYVSGILKAAGEPIRTGPPRLLDENEVNQLYNCGLSTYEIATKFGCSDETVRRLIHNPRSITETNLSRTADTITKIAVSCKAKWEEDEYKAKVRRGTSTPEYKAALSKAGKANFAAHKKRLKTPEVRKKISDAIKRNWLDQEYRSKMMALAPIFGKNRSDVFKEQVLGDPERRQQWIDNIRKASAAARPHRGWVSSSQRQLYYLLGISGIVFHTEGENTRVGPFYTTDCVIPQQQDMRRPLVVEVNGEYFHSLPNVVIRDRQKATYIKHHTGLDLLVLSDLDLRSFEQVAAKFADFGLTLNSVICSTKDTTIRIITEQIAQDFYGVFHYSNTIRKGATTFGAYLDDKLLAALSYTSPLRLETAKSLDLEPREVVEISRLARITNVVCSNLLTFLIGRTKRQLPGWVKCLVSFSDNDQQHTGGVYRAAGFICDRTLGTDYYYVSQLGGRFHKKTVWDRAKRLKLSEPDYAEKHGLIRVPSGEKLRWILRLR